jgi:prepilin-type N-terminal cleavage/methylation domain-containing protein
MIGHITGLRHYRRGFTLVEIMIVVAFIGLLSVLAVPGFIKNRKQSQGRRIVNDARQMDSAISQWAMEKNQADGATILTSEAASYLKMPWPANDLLGHLYIFSGVGSTQVQINATTKTDLGGVGIDWGPY